MLIKPLNRLNESKPKVRVNSLPSVNDESGHQAYFGTIAEHNYSLRIEGRLLMLTTMYKEYWLKQNKSIHNILCAYKWPVCQCHFAKSIRGMDILLSADRINQLMEVL